MRTEKDVEAYLLRQGRRFEPVEGSGMPTYLVRSASEGLPPVAIRVEAPLVVVRAHIADVRAGDATLFRRLLELNARGLVHTCYGLEGDRVVLSAAMELENLDFNELAAVLDEIDLALAQQVPELFEVQSKQGKA